MHKQEKLLTRDEVQAMLDERKFSSRLGRFSKKVWNNIFTINGWFLGLFFFPLGFLADPWRSSPYHITPWEVLIVIWISALVFQIVGLISRTIYRRRKINNKKGTAC